MILGDSAEPEAIEAMREEMGLNDPVLVQYGRYMVNLLHGDMGTSYTNQRPVAHEVFSRVPATFELALVSAVVSILIAIPLGVVAAVKQNTLFDNLSMVLSRSSNFNACFLAGIDAYVGVFAAFRMVPGSGKQ